MQDLSLFLAGNALPEENIFYAATKRFRDPDGNPVLWELRPISTEEDEAIRKQYTKRVPVPGRKGQYTKDVDIEAYLCAVAAQCTVFPNLKDAELQNSYHVMGEEALLRALLNKPGEYQDFLNKINEVNGFQSMDELVEEVKN